MKINEKRYEMFLCFVGEWCISMCEHDCKYPITSMLIHVGMYTIIALLVKQYNKHA